ncbi:hypothetical protein K501DRAFT_30196 [Backusella circina FSU 941]|nr:hypothetical protein K501DRAFT_30196 [Backusella circina FSU 941]
MQQDLNIDEKNWKHPYNITAYPEVNKSSNRRHTISYYTDSTSDSSEKCSKMKKKLKRRSMNDCTTRKVKVETSEENCVPDLPDKFAKSSFGHLSREELIQRVVQLEKEKSLSKQLDSTSSEKNISNLLQVPPLDNSDEEDTHSCQWSDCNTVTTTLDHLIVHIQDIHIGSGKPAYYCEWAGCPRNQKPFLKRHKMQNHMRTHTGERPFVCQVEGCDKRFSRPDSLNTHIKTHSSIRPYACLVPGCGKAYFHSRSLRKHSKSHEPSSSVCTSPADMKEEYYRHYQYENSMNNPIYYQAQMSTCGSEARKTQVGFAQYEPMAIPNHRPAMPFVPNAGGALSGGYYQDNCTPIINSNHPAPTFYHYQEQQQQIYAAGPVHAVVPPTSSLHSNTNTGHLQMTDQNPYSSGQHYYIY